MVLNNLTPFQTKVRGGKHLLKKILDNSEHFEQISKQRLGGKGNKIPWKLAEFRVSSLCPPPPPPAARAFHRPQHVNACQQMSTHGSYCHSMASRHTGPNQVDKSGNYLKKGYFLLLQPAVLIYFALQGPLGTLLPLCRQLFQNEKSGSKVYTCMQQHWNLLNPQSTNSFQPTRVTPDQSFLRTAITVTLK